MSSKNYRSEPDPLDRYPTPVKLVRAGFEMVCEVTDIVPSVGYMLEPGCGPGTFCHVAKNYCHGLKAPPVGVDLDFEWALPLSKFTRLKKDFLKWKPKRRWDLIATNPPFSIAEEFIRHSRELLNPVRGRMLYLCRIGLAGSIKRIPMWKEINLLEVWMIRPRPSFMLTGGSDSSEYAFFLMDAQRENCSLDVRFRWVDW
jgi:hypothetical protein